MVMTLVNHVASSAGGVDGPGRFSAALRHEDVAQVSEPATVPRRSEALQAELAMLEATLPRTPDSPRDVGDGSDRLESGFPNDLEKFGIVVQWLESRPLPMVRRLGVSQPIHLLEAVQCSLTLTEGEVHAGHRKIAEARSSPVTLEPIEHGPGLVIPPDASVRAPQVRERQPAALSQADRPFQRRDRLAWPTRIHERPPERIVAEGQVWIERDHCTCLFDRACELREMEVGTRNVVSDPR